MLTAFCLSLVVNRASILSSACTYSRLRYLSYRYFLLGMNHPTTLFSESQNCIANSLERIPCKSMNALFLVSSPPLFSILSRCAVSYQLIVFWLLSRLSYMSSFRKNVPRKRRIMFGSKTLSFVKIIRSSDIFNIFLNLLFCISLTNYLDEKI